MHFSQEGSSKMTSHCVCQHKKNHRFWGDNNPLCFPWGSFPEYIRDSYTTGCLWRTHQDYCLELILLTPSHLLKHHFMLMSQHWVCFLFKVAYFSKLVLIKCWSIPHFIRFTPPEICCSRNILAGWSSVVKPSPISCWQIQLCSQKQLWGWFICSVWQAVGSLLMTKAWMSNNGVFKPYILEGC